VPGSVNNASTVVLLDSKFFSDQVPVLRMSEASSTEGTTAETDFWCSVLDWGEAPQGRRNGRIGRLFRVLGGGVRVEQQEHVNVDDHTWVLDAECRCHDHGCDVRHFGDECAIGFGASASVSDRCGRERCARSE